jgi:hypothetical protein
MSLLSLLIIGIFKEVGQSSSFIPSGKYTSTDLTQRS